MNSAHLHLIINHFPIFGVLIGTLVLLTGLVLKKSDIQFTALSIFIFSAIASIFAFYTGEGAQEVVGNISGVSETLIHTHEEYAETFFVLILILGITAIITFIAKFRKARFHKHLMVITIILAIASGVMAKYVGASGGVIRHTEIRSNALVINLGD